MATAQRDADLRLWSTPLLWAALAAAIMLAEYLTGPEIDLVVWYAVPVGLLAWYHGLRWGVPVAVAMPLVRISFSLLGLWGVAGTLRVPAVNAASQAAALSLLAVIAGRLGHHMRHAVAKARAIQELQQELDGLERDAGTAPAPLRAQLFNRAGDLCAAVGERPRAAAYWGRATDSYLEARQYDRAAAVCAKLVRASPAVVRAHATLALIAIGKHLPGEAERHVADYVNAAIAASQEPLAAASLRAMADAAGDEGVRQAIEDHLVRLSHVAASDNAGPRREAEPDDSESAPLPEDEERWRRLVEVARRAPTDLTQGG